MSDPYGPKRRQTNPIPRVELPPISKPLLEDLDDDITAVHCPACCGCVACDGRHLLPSNAAGTQYAPCAECADCSYCQGLHLVTPQRAAEFGKS